MKLYRSTLLSLKLLPSRPAGHIFKQTKTIDNLELHRELFHFPLYFNSIIELPDLICYFTGIFVVYMK